MIRHTIRRGLASLVALVCLTAPGVRAQGGDRDGDGWADSQDNCPYFANEDQTDTDSDGRGNACECTDQTGDGRNNVGDIVAINVAIFTPALATPLCDGNNDNQCNVADIIAANIEIFSPTSTSTCARQPVPERPPTDRGALLLNEVRFAPLAADPPFIELKSVGATSAALETFTITNERGEQLHSPGEVTVPTGGVVLIVFDGDTRIEGTTIHVNRPGFLSADSGELELGDPGGAVIDRIRWGDRPGSASRGRGGFASGFPEGGSIGRFPSSIAIDPAGWEAFERGEVTPGGANPLPRVRVLLPFSGALFDSGSIDLAWYPPPGATRYRVQLASNASFASPILDVMVDDPELTTSALASGTYSWRVQSISDSGTAAAFSEASVLTVEGAPSGAVSSLSGLLGATGPTQNALLVPLKAQRKDTGLLLLETPRETGTHAWDAPHTQGSMADAADWTCAAASVAMINAFFGGSLSQDRINFAALRDDLDGPEGDLIFGQGLGVGHITRALTFALGAAPAGYFVVSGANVEVLWSAIKGEVDSGRPLLMAKSGSVQGHVGVIRGYREDANGRRVVINDPSPGRSYQIPLSALLDGHVWLIPTSVIARSDEPELSMDSDGDGLRDFDEVSRFHTDPNDRDSDGDSVSDYLDVRASVYDPDRGYANGFRASDLRRIDPDRDSHPMELDRDSDGDGCTDGFEDSNQNGRFEPESNETWNFDGQDLGCRFTGSVSATRHMTIEIEGESIYTHTTSESTSATNLVWELDPFFGDGAGGRRRFRLVSGAVSWSHQGVVDLEPREPGSSYPCSGSASGSDLVGGTEFEAEIIIDDTTTPATIEAQAGVLTPHYASYACADGVRVDQPVALPAVYFSTDGPKSLPAGGQGPVPSTLTGSATLIETQPGVSIDVSWHWNFVGVPE